MKLLRLLLIMQLAGWCLSATGQTTQPVPAGWQQQVRRLADALGQESATARRQIAADVGVRDSAIRSFDGPARQLEDVLAHTAGAKLLMAQAYVYPSGNIAGDISTAVVAEEMSDAVKKILVPGDGEPTARANQTASRWAQGALGLQAADWFGVMVYYTGDVVPAEHPEAQVYVVLCKGKSDGNKVNVSLMVCGDLQHATLPAGK